jgi:tetratricopeptide (TPR) repeat protein
VPPSPDAAPRSAEPAELFISYASPDRARAEALHRRLEAAGFTAWFDQARLQRGDDWPREITARADAARLVLPVLTPHWHASQWAKYETYGARAVLPLVAEGAPAAMLPPPLRHLHAPVFDPLAASEADWQALFSDIRRECAMPLAEPLPAFQHLPHEPNRWFTGREAEMNALHEALHPGPSADPDSLAWAITGLGGLGKTTLVSEYARRFRRLYPQILWVWGDRDYMLQFAGLYDAVVGAPAPAGMPHDAKAARVMQALSSDATRLLVLDNVTEPAAAHDWIPRSRGCRTLITARDTAFPPAVRRIDLTVLTPPASRAFLCARTARAAEGAEGTACDRLTERLEGLPLALEQAAAYMAAQRIGFAKYLGRYEEEAAALLARPVPGFTHYAAPVATTWHMTLRHLPPEARAVLRLCSALGSAPIALPMFLDGARQVAVLGDTLPALQVRRSWLPWGGRRDAASVRPPRAPDRETARRTVRDAVAEGLHRYSMIQDWDGDAETFRVHALVREVEWLAMVDQGAQRYACKLLSAMLAPYVPADSRDEAGREACDAALAHGAEFWRRLRQAALDWPDEKLPGELYECAASRGAVAAAEDYAYQHYEAARQHRGAISAVTQRAAERVARSLYDRGEYAKALSILQVILHGHEVQDGPDHPNTLATVNNLAACMEALGDAAGALPLHRRALDSFERVLGKEHPDTLISVNNLADTMRALGDAAGAVPLFRRALDSKEHVLGKEHPDTLTSVNSLAVCMQALGDAAGALPLYRRALHSRERVLGMEHPHTLSSVDNLALCMKTLGDAAGALPLYRRALDSRERVLGKEHPDTLTSVNNLAGCMEALGDAAGALPLYRRAVEGSERVLGKEHPATLTSVNNLAACMDELGDAAGALPLYRRALDSRERVLGKEHPDTLASVHNLAYCLHALGDAAGALPLYRRALEGSERVLGPDHPQTRTFATNLASLLGATDAPARAPPPKPEQPAWALGATPLTAPPAPAGLGYTLDLAALLAQVAEPAPTPRQPPGEPP